MKKIEHVAVIGGGIMGGGIAAFFANLGLTCDLCDIDIKISEGTLAKISDPKSKIPVLYTPRFVKRITPRASADMESFLKKADFIVEAVPEKMDLKKKIFATVDRFRREDSIVATNTSGLSINEMAAGLSESFHRHFIGTHYFNPVRFLPLVELIPAKETDPEIVALLASFYAAAGKKTVVCKDTPNFIANRIGVFALMKTLALMDKYGFDVETVDMLTGSPMGNPNTATLRLSDMVGIETIVEVSMNVYNNCPNDECKDVFLPPKWLERMVAEKMFGDKTGKGFYQKGPKRSILALDLQKWEYLPKKEPKSNAVRLAKEHQDVRRRVYTLCCGTSPANLFSRELILSTAAYSLNRVGEISDSIATIDNALRWGFGREIGPIEVLDAIGVQRSREWMQELKIPVPAILDEVAAKTKSVYHVTETSTAAFDRKTGGFVEEPKPQNVISLQVLKASNKVVRENLSARLLDLGDNVLMLELDHKMVPAMNPIDTFVMEMMQQIPGVMRKEGFRALVIGNQAANFCAGAQLQMILEMSQAKAWDKIHMASQMFQMANMYIYHSPVPVVVAPHGMTLGGGMEITLASHKRVAYSELYGGLVEVGVGLLPGAAGNLLLLMQFMDTLAATNPGFMPPVMKAFELIGFGTVSNSAYDAIDKGFLTRDDVVVFSKDEQIQKAKEVALAMIPTHKAKPERELSLPGQGGYLVMESSIDDFVTSGKITAHSAVIAKKQAYVLTGGSKASPTTPVSESYILELEREAFVSLCGEEKSQERMAYMLKNKKPLIN